MLAHPLGSWCRACGLATTESEFNCLL
jgi:hypothetical protein